MILGREVLAILAGQALVLRLFGERRRMLLVLGRFLDVDLEAALDKRAADPVDGDRSKRG